MATPVVAGAAALVIGLLNTHGLASTPSQVESILLDGALKTTALSTQVRDGNRLDLGNLAHHIQNGIIFSGQGGFAEER
jgi:hypothetical protein